jgi:hypothetical protein
MFVNPTRSSTAEPSAFYLMMAATCFQQAGCARRPGARSTLCDSGRKYLTKADRGIPTRECPLQAADSKGGSELALENQS